VHFVVGVIDRAWEVALVVDAHVRRREHAAVEAIDGHYPARNRRFRPLSALRAHTKAPYGIDLL
jgi:hypothetical protein